MAVVTLLSKMRGLLYFVYVLLLFNALFVIAVIRHWHEYTAWEVVATGAAAASALLAVLTGRRYVRRLEWEMTRPKISELLKALYPNEF